MNVERIWGKGDEVRWGLVYIGDVWVENEGYMFNMEIVWYKGNMMSYGWVVGVMGKRVRR